jgi:thiol-disulfide isomerase/thioredoxin
MKLFLGIFTSVFISVFSVAQITVSPASLTPFQVKISGSIFNTTSKEVKLSRQVDNNQFTDLATVPLDKDGKFEISTKISQSDYYLLRVNEGSVHLILREDSDIKVYGDAKQLGKFTNFVNSDESATLHTFAYAADDWVRSRNEAIQRIQKNPELSEQINSEIQTSLREFQGVFQTFYSENQNSPALIAALNVIDPNSDFETFETIVNALNRTFGQSQKVQQLQVAYTQLRAKKDAENMFAPGKPAPDFEELMVDRKTTMKLSDLRGKVVLLDFWASWCGPCRKENPNVVAVFNKYKDKGFTVMNVSLDDNLDRWKQAIEQDGLIWPNHVSDLKKWNSAAGQIYQVRSIPFTVLIDQKGNIVATNLRGPALEEAVSKLLQ